MSEGEAMVPVTPSPPRDFKRAPGLWILVALVATGLLVPAFYLWSVPRLKQEADRLRVEGPSDPVERVAIWFRYGQPKLHHALVMARFSAERPWYVTHLVSPESGDQPPEIWGIDFSTIDVDAIRLDGMVVRVVLPAPSLLARDVLVGDKAFGVPVFAPDARPKDPRALTRERLERYLEPMSKGIAKDIPGARLSVEIGAL